MADFIFPFFLGYVLARLLHFFFATPETRQTGVVLKWCKESLGRRPTRVFEIDEDSRYMFATPIDSDVVASLIKINNADRTKD